MVFINKIIKAVRVSFYTKSSLPVLSYLDILIYEFSDISLVGKATFSSRSSG